MKPYTPPAAWKGKVHAHACTSCHHRYEDNCRDLLIDGTCNQCISGIPNLRSDAWAPRPCCVQYTVLCDKYLRTQLRLAGAGPWFKCKACARTFGYEPDFADPRTRWELA